jgi:hypothetical protein
VKLGRLRKPKFTCFLSYVEYSPNINANNYYEKQVTLRGGCIREKESKRRKLRR